MKDIQNIFDRLKEKKQERKKLKEAYVDAISNSKSYQDVVVLLRDLKSKKNAMEAEIWSQFADDLEKIERMKVDIEADTQALSDLALTTLMRGETVEVKDSETDIAYEPIFTVRFKRG